MKRKKMRNPLLRRLPRELTGDWKKYFVVAAFLILTIGFVSGMYVANESMMTAADEGVTKYKLEDGHFELDKKADEELLAAISAGDRADIRQYYTDEAKKELDEKFAGEFDEKFREEFDQQFAEEFEKQFEEQVKQTLLAQGLDEETAETMLAGAIETAKAEDSYQTAYDEAYQAAYDEAYPDAYETAYNEAWAEISDEIDEKYADAAEKYELDSTDFSPVPVTVYENFYRNEDEDDNDDGTVDGTVRVYKKTEEINLACLLKGEFPGAADEIAIDRMHADNVGVQVGDTISVGGQEYRVTGLIAYVNYSTLHEKNTDLMFDALKFNVAMVTEEGFDRLSKSVHCCYAWKYEDAPADTVEEKEKSDSFMKALLTQTVTADNEITDYLPVYTNQAVHFATDDMGSDEAMGGVLLDILIVIIAFIFAITISNTIAKEASTIGTLRALGYTRGELVRHYLATPVIVTFFSAVVGNLLGYTLFKGVVVSMYYNSYSLPTYETIWNPDAFVKTTVIPVALMFVVNLFVISRMLKLTPLQFLRHDLKKTKRKKAMRLPRWSFFARFRMRIILQNIPSYVVLFVGIFFISVTMAMAVGMTATLKYYQADVDSMMFADYQYVLTSCEDEDGNPVTTKSAQAEPFCMTSLLRKSSSLDEEVSVYGISDGSSYVEIDGLSALTEGEVYLSESFADKYSVSVGDTVTLDEKYENKQYQFTVAGTYGKSQGIAVFMPISKYREIFELDEEEFTGYLSNEELDDIDEDLIATVITVEDITKMANQLDHSMGSYMEYFQVLCILLSAVMIYLLTKIIIEKNENAISMTKILGYENGEIARLYLLSTTIVLLVEDAFSVILGSIVMGAAWRVILFSYSGWFAFYMGPKEYGKMYLFILLGYLIVMVFDFRRIKRIPMDEALKNVE